MPWISVHDHVAGGKLRELAKHIKCSQKEALGILVSLWLWGLNNADQTGMLRSCDKLDIAEEVFSKGLSEGLEKNDIVDGLIQQRWIDEVDGALYLHDWDVWQEHWYKFLKARDYDAERKRRERAMKKAEKQQEEAEKESCSKVEAAGAQTEINAEVKKKPTKKKSDKKQYADFVALKEEEYQKLVYGYGQRATDKFIEELNLYKGSTGKTYKSDYMTILNWVTEKVEKKYPGIIQRPAPEKIKRSEMEADENPFGQWKE